MRTEGPLTGNFAQVSGGGVFISGSTTTIRHGTFTWNTALTGGGGIWRKTANSTPVGDMTIINSIITGNTAPDTPNVNLAGIFSGSNNLTAGNPLLAPLGAYGGLTQTMPPMPGSPVIHAGGSATLTTDQRGFPRVGVADIGAAEYQGSTDLARFWKLDMDGDGIPYGVEQALGTNPFMADPNHPQLLTKPTFDAAGHAVLGFGLATAVPGTRWRLTRSFDLSLGSFVEIYSTDGIADSSVSGVSYVRKVRQVTVTDENSLAGKAFYRFEAVLEP